MNTPFINYLNHAHTVLEAHAQKCEVLINLINLNNQRITCPQAKAVLTQIGEHIQDHQSQLIEHSGYIAEAIDNPQLLVKQ